MMRDCFPRQRFKPVRVYWRSLTVTGAMTCNLQTIQKSQATLAEGVRNPICSKATANNRSSLLVIQPFLHKSLHTKKNNSMHPYRVSWISWLSWIKKHKTLNEIKKMTWWVIGNKHTFNRDRNNLELEYKIR